MAWHKAASQKPPKVLFLILNGYHYLVVCQMGWKYGCFKVLFSKYSGYFYVYCVVWYTAVSLKSVWKGEPFLLLLEQRSYACILSWKIGGLLNVVWWEKYFPSLHFVYEYFPQYFYNLKTNALYRPFLVKIVQCFDLFQRFWWWWLTWVKWRHV